MLLLSIGKGKLACELDRTQHDISALDGGMVGYGERVEELLGVGERHAERDLGPLGRTRHPSDDVAGGDGTRWGTGLERRRIVECAGQDPRTVRHGDARRVAA